MLGMICYGEGSRKPELAETSLWGVSFLTLRLGESSHPNSLTARRRASGAARALAAHGVRHAVFPVDFPYAALFVRQGVYPVDTLPLRRTVAPDTVKRRLSVLGREPGKAIVALAGNGLTGESIEAVRTLALNYRYVLADFTFGGEELAKSLRRDYGVSLLLHPGTDALNRADALLLYAPRQDITGENPVFLALYPGAGMETGHVEITLPPALAEKMPRNCNREQLAAALFGAGVLRREAVLLD